MRFASSDITVSRSLPINSFSIKLKTLSKIEMIEWLVILWLALTYWKLDDIYKLLKILTLSHFL